MSETQAEYKVQPNRLKTQTSNLLLKIQALKKSTSQQWLLDNPKFDWDKRAIHAESDTLFISLSNTLRHYDNQSVSELQMSVAFSTGKSVFLELTKSYVNWFSHTSHSTTD